MSEIESFYLGDLGLILYLVPIVTAFCAFLGMILKKDRNKSQLYLSWCFLLIGIAMTVSFWYERYGAKEVEVLRTVNFTFNVPCVVAILIYFTSLIKPQQLNIKYYIKNILPPLIFFVLVLYFQEYINSFKSSTLDGYLKNISNPKVLMRLGGVVFLILFEFSVLFRCIKLYKQHKIFVHQNFSFKEEIDLKWIEWSFLIFSLFAFVDLLWICSNNIIVKFVFFVFATVLLVVLFYSGSRQKDVPAADVETHESNDQNDQNDSALDMGRYKELKQPLLDYFNEKQPYLNSELTLSHIVLALNTNRSYISRLINKEFRTTFYEFVNSYRLDHILNMMEEWDNSTKINYLIFEAGFKSKAVFYRLFKEKMGCLPSEYLRKKNS